MCSSASNIFARRWHISQLFIYGLKTTKVSQQHEIINQQNFERQLKLHLRNSRPPLYPVGYRVIRELKQAMFLSTRTSTGSKSRRYRWRMMVSTVLVLNQQRQSISFHVRDFERERLMPSFAIYNGAIYFR